jgi:LPPG:FO 2-phospho-L-lactate transferase
VSAEFILVLTGGIGGAKLCLGLQRILPAASLHIAVNTGDDFEHLGLHICPDIDTTIYTLSGLANPEVGWGRRNETWSFMRALESLGGETWFQLGDSDLALHIERTRRLAAGESLSFITRDLAVRLGVHVHVAPMSDQPVRTVVSTPRGDLAFQDYFVRLRCEPVVTALTFRGAATARVSEPVAEALRAPGLRAIVIAPSNPYLSVDPILSIPDMRPLLQESGVPVIAVTPLIAGAAVKGPTAKIMHELGVSPSPLSIVEHYRGVIHGFVLDSRDASLADQIDVPVQLCDTLMRTVEDRERVAASVLEFIVALTSPSNTPTPEVF